MGLDYILNTNQFYMRFFFIILISISWSCSSPKNEELKLNQIQVIGSHNSYKQAIEQPIMQMLLAKDSDHVGLDYRHLPLKEQLDLGIRGLEIDVLHDPAGGRYSDPVGLKLLKQKGLASLPYDTLDQLSGRGLKVFHVPDIDFRSHCLTFIGCLTAIKEWSDENPDHIPLIITINPKDSGVKEPGFTSVLPFTKQVLDSVDLEILSVFPASRLITPDQVKGKYPTLREAVTTGGWPSLKSVKGKILFVFDANETITELYIKPSLKGKPMFANVAADHSDAAFFIMNDPKSQLAEIKEKVRAGFMVRTRADADTREARAGDYTRFDAAMASGAQLISTDYYQSALSPSRNFHVTFSDGKYQRCNPVTASVNCEL